MNISNKYFGYLLIAVVAVTSAFFVSNNHVFADNYGGVTLLDIGLRVSEAGGTVAIAIEPNSYTPMSPLRIAKSGTIYGIALVDPADPNATHSHIKLANGSVMALRKFNGNSGNIYYCKAGNISEDASTFQGLYYCSTDPNPILKDVTYSPNNSFTFTCNVGDAGCSIINFQNIIKANNERGRIANNYCGTSNWIDYPVGVSPVTYLTNFQCK